MFQKIRGSILFVVLCILSGCAKAPEAETENGIQYAYNESDESIKNII